MSHRTIFLIDGENLVHRYQSMIDDGFTPDENTLHKKDVIVWNNNIFKLFKLNIIRISYYSTFVGDDAAIEKISNEISNIKFCFHYPSGVTSGTGSGTINPHIYKKKRKSVKTNSVDINIAIDALRHSYNNDIDNIVLLTGDGDYLPLIEEVMRNGKQVVVGAFSKGCHPKLKYAADDFINLDALYFKDKNT